MDPETQALIDAAMNGAPAGDAATAATPTAGGPIATPTPAPSAGNPFAAQRYVLVKGGDGIDYSVDLTTGTATPIKGLPGQATPAAKKIVKAPDGTWSLVDPTTGQATSIQGMPTAPPKNVPAADQTMPGTGTPETPAVGGSTGNLSTAMGDAYVPPTTEGTAAMPDLTVAQYGAQTTRQNDLASRAISQQNADTASQRERTAAAQQALNQTNAELAQGQRAITNAYNQQTLTLDQAKAAADLLYKQADIELRARIADQTFGQNVADTEMKRLPAGTLAATGQAWQSATQGKYVPAQLPPDNRDPVQIALNAIAQLKAGQGPTPAQTALQNATMPGLTLPQPGAAAAVQPAAAAVQPAVLAPLPPPQFPQMGSPIGRY